MKLFENWNDSKDKMLSGLTESKKKIVAPLLENQKQHLEETAAAGTNTAGAIGNFQKIAIPMIRRVIPGTIASEIVGMQPLAGPVGLVYSMRFAFSETATNSVPADVVTAGDEAFGNNGKMSRYYSGDVETGEGLETSILEAAGGRQMQLEVLKQTVTAKSRKLQAKWTIEAMQDLNASHALNLESEITAALSAEIVQEIDNEIITDLANLAGTSETFDMAGSFTGTPNYIGDRHAVLGGLINKVANEIARKTRRGAGNFVVVSPLVASILQSAAKSVFAPAVQGSFEGPNNTRLVGTLNGSIKVYTYLFSDTVGTGGEELCVVGYKGGNGELDAGYFYCPYIPLQATSVVTDPSTYNQQVSLMTRYGKAVFTDSNSSLGNSADYYGKVAIQNVTFA